MQMFNGVLRIRQEAEDARRVLAEPAAHCPPVEPGPYNGGCDSGSRLPGLSASEFAESVESLVGGCARVPTSESSLKSSAHGVMAEQLESGMKLLLNMFSRVILVSRMELLQFDKDVVNMIAS